jgi:hypothetical protein
LRIVDELTAERKSQTSEVFDTSEVLIRSFSRHHNNNQMQTANIINLIQHRDLKKRGKKTIIWHYNDVVIQQQIGNSDKGIEEFNPTNPTRHKLLEYLIQGNLFRSYQGGKVWMTLRRV